VRNVEAPHTGLVIIAFQPLALSAYNLKVPSFKQAKRYRCGQMVERTLLQNLPLKV